MIVSPARDETQTLFLQLGRKRFGINQNLALILFEVFAQRFTKRDGLGGDDVNQRSALYAGEQFSIDLFCVLFFAENQAAARTTQSLVSRAGDVIGNRHGRGM